MQLQPTAKARLDLHPGVQTLTLRERSLLLLADARKPSGELRRLFNGMGEQIVIDLVRQGYLAPVGDGGEDPAARDASPKPEVEREPGRPGRSPKA